METATGMIAVVQEGRFLLARPDGGLQLMILAPGAGVEAQDLPDLARRARTVRVAWTPISDRRAAVATRVEEAQDPAPRSRP
jgi:hypothetical protein